MEQINWQGGQIEVVRASVDGWEVSHRTADGATYSVDWNKTKTNALRVAKTIAAQRNAKLLVEA